jgi:hypothetical protein
LPGVFVLGKKGTPSASGGWSPLFTYICQSIALFFNAERSSCVGRFQVEKGTMTCQRAKLLTGLIETKLTTLKSLLIYITLFLLPIFIVKGSFCQLIATGDTTICKGGSAQLSASGGGVSYFWYSYPTDPSLLIPQQQNQVVSPQVSTMYVVQSNIATGNLILNGTFELGVMGFSSEYVNNQVSIVEEGTYAVVNDAHTVHPNFYCNEDHTTGSGKFMAVNGAGVANVKVWYLTLNNVQPDVRYEFSTWITSLHPTNPATLQFSINGELMGQPFQAYPTTCDWYQFFHIWDADTNHHATISIVNQNTILSGNDFALDDISFATVLVYYDTVYFEVLTQFNSPFSAPASACTEELINVTYSGNAPDTANFHWDFSGASILSGSGPGPYEIVYSVSGNPQISLWVDGDGCASDTGYRDLTIGESPVVSASADDLILPYGSSTTLHGSYSGGLGPYDYEWSHPELLVDPASLDPLTLALNFTTAFILSVTDQSANCTGHDTVIVEVAGGPLGINVIAEPDEICPGEQSVLTAQPMGGTENYTYSWTSNPPGFTSDLFTVTVQPITSTQYTITINDGLSSVSQSVTVTVHSDPFSYAGVDVIIPYGTSANLQGTGSGGSGNYLYYWVPADMVTNPNSSVTQTVNLVSTIIFSLTVTDQVTGCIGEPDEVIVQVEGGPLAVVINSDKPAVCEGESAILTAWPSGGNQGNYTYTWTDNLGNAYPSTAQITITPDETLVYHIVVYDGFNTTEAFKELVVYPSTEFTWAGGSDQIMACPTESILLKPAPQLPGWSYLWSNGSVEDQITVGVTGIGFSLQSYTLTTTSGEGCSFSKSIQVIFDFSYCFGIGEEHSDLDVCISPNPGNGAFKVEWQNAGAFNILTVYSPVSGKLFEKSVTGLREINADLSSLPAGVYILYLQGTGGILTRKVLIYP